MLEKELLISQLAEMSNIDFSTSDELWNVTVDYIERLLSQNKKVLFSDKLCFYTKVHSEVYVTLSDDTKYILPPRVDILVSLPSSIVDESPVNSLDSKIIAELSNKEYSIVDEWCKAIDFLFEKELNNGSSIFFRDLATIKPIFEDNILIGISVSIDDNLKNKINKPFSMFEPVEVTSIDENKDIEHIEAESLETISDKDKEYILFYKDTSEICSDIEDQENPENKEIGIDDDYREETYNVGLIPRDDFIEETVERNNNRRKWIFVLPIIFILALFIIFSRQIWGFVTGHNNTSTSISNTLDSSKTDDFVIILNDSTNTNSDSIVNDTISNNNVDSLSYNIDSSANVYVDESVKHLDDDTTKNEVIKSKPTTKAVNNTEIALNDKDKSEIVTIKKGDRLTIYALKKYGKKVFWVYIYEENRNIIKDPDNIAIGTKLVLPPASKYKIDPNNNKSVHTALVIEKSIKEIKNKK